MAAFLTANRWSSGIGTHKTKEGRILCTGVGCLGCFPENNQTEADELGVCDLDFKGHPFRPWLNDDVAKGKKAGKTSQKRPENNNKRDEISAESFSKIPRGKCRQTTAYLRSTSTQTEDKHNNESIVANFTGLSKETRKVLNSMLKGQDFEKTEHSVQFRDSEISRGSKLFELEDTIEYSKYSIKDDYNYNELANSVNRNVNKTARILENLYLASKKDTALNSYDNILPTEKPRDFTENSPWDLGENAVCLYFAIEYFNCVRMLPDFKVLEIVEALSDVMSAKDIKCVQKVAGMWQIVLRQRTYLPYFRENGLTIRGRQYELVDAIDSYCDVIYNE